MSASCDYLVARIYPVGEFYKSKSSPADSHRTLINSENTVLFGGVEPKDKGLALINHQRLFGHNQRLAFLKRDADMHEHACREGSISILDEASHFERTRGGIDSSVDCLDRARKLSAWEGRSLCRQDIA